MYNKSDSPQYSSSFLSQAMVIADSSSLGTLTSLAAVRQVTKADGLACPLAPDYTCFGKTSLWLWFYLDSNSGSRGRARPTFTRRLPTSAAAHTCARYTAVNTVLILDVGILHKGTVATQLGGLGSIPGTGRCISEWSLTVCVGFLWVLSLPSSKRHAGKLVVGVSVRGCLSIHVMSSCARF